MQIDLFYELAVPPARAAGEAEVYRETLEEIALADTLGFGCAWLVEHHLAPGYSHATAPDLFLAAVSQRTSRIRLGHAVVVAPCHHPLRVAERAATLDVLSGGRLELGLGRGFSAAEYAIFGARPEESRARLAEGLAVLRAAAVGPIAERGPFHDLGGVSVLPRPLQRPHPPLWLAAISPESVAWAAEQGLGLLAGPFKPWFMIRQDIARYRRTFRVAHGTGPPAEGRNPRVALALGVLCLEDAAEARRLGAEAFTWFYRRLIEEARPVLRGMQASYEYYHRFRRLAGLLERAVSLPMLERLGLVVVGDPAGCARRFAAFRRAGIDRLLCAIGAGALPSAVVRRSMALMARHLLPQP
ncbi:MAG: LLM class flavin-dependent oxidoreductase [Rhodospirillales bacterium]|nr:LLM class flavin-dependent oxidoreductase [Rhodospirillales bacterium]